MEAVLVFGTFCTLVAWVVNNTENRRSYVLLAIKTFTIQLITVLGLIGIYINTTETRDLY